MGRRVLGAGLIAALIIAGILVSGTRGTPGNRLFHHWRAVGPTPAATGIHKIKHVIVIMQENRSFDSYFGTYPGADGIPGLAGNPGTVPCLPDPRSGSCLAPFHDRHDQNVGGPHGTRNARRDIRHGLMNGFVIQQERGIRHCEQTFNPACGTESSVPDVMGYHTGADLPNYWAYARNFVLQDHMFESDSSWSLPSHLYLMSGWSARCRIANDPWSCHNNDRIPGLPPDYQKSQAHLRGLTLLHPQPPHYAWTDITYLLHQYHVSWRYYVFGGHQPDCAQDQAIECPPVKQNAKTPGIWNPLPYFDTVRNDGQMGDIQPLRNFFTAARTGTLPEVSWITPTAAVSDHPPALVSAGQSYVTSLINAVMRSPDWKSTAIFVTWDDWGGFYDHLPPPHIDRNGYGIRVPGLLISPYAKRGFIDHQTLSFDAFLKFIEDDFLGGQRIDPRTDGRPDPRPDVREDAPQLGNLVAEFDFNQPPRPPMFLPLNPHTDLIQPSLGGIVTPPGQSSVALTPRVEQAVAAYLHLAPLTLATKLAAGQPLPAIARQQGKSPAAIRRLLTLLERLGATHQRHRHRHRP